MKKVIVVAVFFLAVTGMSTVGFAAPPSHSNRGTPHGSSASSSYHTGHRAVKKPIKTYTRKGNRTDLRKQRVDSPINRIQGGPGSAGTKGVATQWSPTPIRYPKGYPAGTPVPSTLGHWYAPFGLLLGVNGTYLPVGTWFTPPYLTGDQELTLQSLQENNRISQQMSNYLQNITNQMNVKEQSDGGDNNPQAGLPNVPSGVAPSTFSLDGNATGQPATGSNSGGTLDSPSTGASGPPKQ